MERPIQRIAAARAAVEAALGVLTDGPEDQAAAALAVADSLEQVGARFEELGDPAALETEAAAAERAELRSALTGLARVHAVLTMTFARRKDALRDQLLLTRGARRGMGWHSGGEAGERCDVRG